MRRSISNELGMDQTSVNVLLPIARLASMPYVVLQGLISLARTPAPGLIEVEGQ